MKPINYHTPLYCGQFYHVYNRTVGNDLLFYEEDNYRFFLQKYFKYLSAKINTYAYCLLPNHFHFLIQPIIDDSKLFSELFRKLFISYSMSINESRNRKGNLFEKTFKRKIIQKEGYLKSAVVYIHSNPARHNLTEDYKNYLHSSYRILISDDSTELMRQDVMEWFGDKKSFLEYHDSLLETIVSEDLIIE